MQGLSAFRVAHCCPSFDGRSPIPSPAPRHRLLLLGFQQRCSFSLSVRDAFAPATRRLKTSPQDEPATEDTLPPLAEKEVSTELAEQEVSTEDGALEEGPKVTVKFILKKKCYYGQRFNVVGNIPLLGNWDVKAAIPMDWTEGDIWMAELDVPAEKEVEFKFVLTGEHGDVKWQPGSNRLFNTEEGISPLVVNEAWMSAKAAEAEAEGEAEAKAGAGAEAEAEAEAEVGATKAVGEWSNLVEETTPSEVTTPSDTSGLLVPADITEDAAADEVVNALESINGEDTPKPKPEAETAPEIPRAELDVAATAVKTALSVDDAA